MARIWPAGPDDSRDRDHMYDYPHRPSSEKKTRKRLSIRVRTREKALALPRARSMRRHIGIEMARRRDSQMRRGPVRPRCRPAKSLVSRGTGSSTTTTNLMTVTIITTHQQLHSSRRHHCTIPVSIGTTTPTTSTGTSTTHSTWNRPKKDGTNWTDHVVKGRASWVFP